jgi:hypothetical protein
MKLIAKQILSISFTISMLFLPTVANTQIFLKSLGRGDFSMLFTDSKNIFAQVIYPKTSQYTRPISHNYFIDINGNNINCHNGSSYISCDNFGNFDDNSYWFFGHDELAPWNSYQNLYIFNIDSCKSINPLPTYYGCNIEYVSDTIFYDGCNSKLFHFPDGIRTDIVFNPPIEGSRYFDRKTKTIYSNKFKENGFFVQKQYNLEGNLISKDSVFYKDVLALPEFETNFKKLHNGGWIVSVSENMYNTVKKLYKISTAEQIVTEFPLSRVILKTKMVIFMYLTLSLELLQL